MESVHSLLPYLYRHICSFSDKRRGMILVVLTLLIGCLAFLLKSVFSEKMCRAHTAVSTSLEKCDQGILAPTTLRRKQGTGLGRLSFP